MSETTIAEIAAAIDATPAAEGAIVATDGIAAAAEGAKPDGTEPEKVEEKKVEQPDDKVAAKFAALSRKEKALKDQERALKKMQAEYEAKMAGVEAEVKGKYIDPADFKKNAYKYMKEQNITLEELAEIVMNDGKQTPEKAVSAAEERLNKKIAEMEAKMAEKETKEQEAELHKVQQNFMTELTGLVNEGDDYELIRANDAVETVYDVIKQHYEATFDEETGQGEILSNKEACDAVEKYLLEEARKLTSAKKVKGLLTPQVEQAVAAKATGDANGKAATKTLTNGLSTNPTKSTTQLTDEERFEQAAKLIKWD